MTKTNSYGVVKPTWTSIAGDINIVLVFDALPLFADFGGGIVPAVVWRDLVQLIHGRGLHDVALSTSFVRPIFFWRTGSVEMIAVIKTRKE